MATASPPLAAALSGVPSYTGAETVAGTLILFLVAAAATVAFIKRRR
ncbi:hypothetical protein KDK95_10135 [Actinospica sp. MGRD01-02]|uniref:Uncharacterized protein n=1 Tax=Actinospica acidithermotolerans TaxID=2828514 RepID=A0A941IKF3_9ACTN|nr:hypothetical protein [Actinospica acidithermotolerans]MBR7826661.1 hypothetical protein [Actinospica acidithermotolerans]